MPTKMSDEDAQFLQDMIVHHKAALTMSNEYLQVDPAKRLAVVSELACNVIEAQTGEIRQMSTWLHMAGRPITAPASGDTMPGMKT